MSAASVGVSRSAACLPHLSGSRGRRAVGDISVASSNVLRHIRSSESVNWFRERLIWMFGSYSVGGNGMLRPEGAGFIMLNSVERL